MSRLQTLTMKPTQHIAKYLVEFTQLSAITVAMGNTCLFWFMSIRTVKWYPRLQLATTTFMSNSECISCRERYFKEVLSCKNFIFHLEGLHPVQ